MLHFSHSLGASTSRRCPLLSGSLMGLRGRTRVSFWHVTDQSSSLSMNPSPQPSALSPQASALDFFPFPPFPLSLFPLLPPCFSLLWCLISLLASPVSLLVCAISLLTSPLCLFPNALPLMPYPLCLTPIPQYCCEQKDELTRPLRCERAGPQTRTGV